MKFFNFLFLQLLILVIVLLVHNVQCESIDKEAIEEGDLDNEENESRKAFEVFTITLGDESEDILGSTSHLRDVVFREGKVQDHWILKKGSKDKKSTSSSLFRHGPYVDRISFDFYFGSFSEYDIHKPNVTSADKTISQPQVIDFEVDDESNTGSYTIVYDCQKHDNSKKIVNTTIHVRLKIFDNKVIEYGFHKQCGGGYHKYLDFGYYLPTENNGVEPVRLTFPTHNLIIGPHITSTRIFLLLNSPAETQEFFHVTAQSENKHNLLINVQGPIFGGVLRKGRATLLYVNYECKTNGKHKVNLTIPLRPFKNLIGTWEKDCGGGIANGLHIGTDGIEDTAGFNNVVSKGVTSASWLMGLSATSGRLGEQAPIVNTSSRIQDFWITNNGIPLHLAKQVITVEKPDVLNVYISHSVMNNGGIVNGNSNTESDDETGILLASNSKMRIRLRFICKRKGRSLILVTFPIKSFEKIDISFIKECRAPKQIYHHSAYFTSINQAMILLSVFCLIVTMMCLGTGSKSNYQKPNEFVGHTNPFTNSGHTLRKSSLNRPGRILTGNYNRRNTTIDLVGNNV